MVLDTLGEVDDPLPEAVRERHGLVGLDDGAAGRCTAPPTWPRRTARGPGSSGTRRSSLQAALAQRRRAAAALPGHRPPAAARGGLLDAFDARLPFSLTDGQRDVGETIAADLARAHPMHRLLQGEVGSGKTVVALRAMLQVVDAGGQAALLAPTEVLAAAALPVDRRSARPARAGGAAGRRGARRPGSPC